MKRNLDDMKHAYENYPVPMEAKERIQMGIDQARAEEGLGNKHSRSYKWVKRTGILVAAATIALVISVNVSSTVAYALQGIPILNTLVDIITVRTFTDKQENTQAKVDIPGVVISGDEIPKELEEGLSNLNEQMQVYMHQIIAQYKKDIDEFGPEAHESLDSSYTIVRNDNELLSVRIDTVFTMGGAANTSKIYHLDKVSGKTITLKDLFEDNSDYIQRLDDFVWDQMKNYNGGEEGNPYFMEDSNFVQEDTNFYINENNELVLVFDEYEVAIGAAGMQEFVIPANEIEDILKVPSYID